MKKLFWMAVVFAAIGTHFAYCARLQAAKIVSVEGSVWVLEPNGSQRKITRKSAGGILYAGDKVKPETGANIVLQHRDGARETITARSSWVLVRRRPTAEEVRIRNEIEKIAATAAKPRPLNSPVTFPLGGEVPASCFVIVLNEPADPSTRIEILDEFGSVVYAASVPQGEIVVSDGSLQTTLSRLRAYDSPVDLELKIQQASGSAKVSFSVMSWEDETALRRALTEIEFDDAGTAHLSRAKVFVSHNLLSLAAIELLSLYRLDPTDTAIRSQLKSLIESGAYPKVRGL